MSNNSTPTKPTSRKSLNSQLDRLDLILDGFADNLNEAVADAVKIVVGQTVQETIRETVQGLIMEVLGNPTILQGIRQALLPMQSPPCTTEHHDPQVSESAHQPRKSSWHSRLWARAARTLASNCGTCFSFLKSAWGYAKLAWAHRWSVLSLSGIAVAVGLGTWFLSPVLAAVMAGLGAASLAVLITWVVALRHVMASVDTLESFLSATE